MEKPCCNFHQTLSIVCSRVNFHYAVENFIMRVIHWSGHIKTHLNTPNFTIFKANLQLVVT